MESSIVNLSQEPGTNKSRAGFSLIEVMIGMAVLGMVLLACLAAMPEIDKIAVKTDCLNEAFTYLNSEIELYRTQRFSEMAAAIGSSVYHSSETTTENHITYTIDHTLEFYTSDNKTIKATIDVQWTFDNQPQSISSFALFSENGLSDKKFSVAN